MRKIVFIILLFGFFNSNAQNVEKINFQALGVSYIKGDSLDTLIVNVNFFDFDTSSLKNRYSDFIINFGILNDTTIFSVGVPFRVYIDNSCQLNFKYHFEYKDIFVDKFENTYSFIIFFDSKLIYSFDFLTVFSSGNLLIKKEQKLYERYSPKKLEYFDNDCLFNEITVMNLDK